MYNLILDIDSYKASHFNQYPINTQQLSSYIEARGGMFSHNVFFGLQRYLKQYLATQITQQDINQAQEFFAAHGLPFNKQGWQYILEKHNGFLPIQISAVAEGSLVPISNVLVQVTNTDPNCYWLVNYLETALLRATWYPTTVATLSFAIKQVLRKFLEMSSDLTGKEFEDHLDFKLHDFGSRGASSRETSAIGGLAHLVNFKGTDSIQSILDGQIFYDEPMAGYSIPASEHSTTTAWGRENELEAYQQLIANNLKEGSIFSMVIDSYDIFNALDNIIAKDPLYSQIKNSKGTLVIRPDSGNPTQMTLMTLESLANNFGYEFNNKGYKVLNSSVRVIQGDGVNYNSIYNICQAITDAGFSLENIAFGMGAELQQKVNRDTSKFAMKLSAIKRNEQWQDAFKQPITDPGKVSKKGVLKLISINGEFKTVRADDEQYASLEDNLEVVFKNGKLLKEYNLNQVRELANSYLETEVKVKNS